MSNSLTALLSDRTKLLEQFSLLDDFRPGSITSSPWIMCLRSHFAGVNPCVFSRRFPTI